LFFITTEQKRGKIVLIALPTSDMGRFIKGEAEAVLKSSIYDLRPYTRPVAGIQSGWKLEDKRLPCRVIVPQLIYKGSIDKNIVEEFSTDLAEHFAFEKPNMVFQYLGYLVQAMVCHYSPGQNPVYYFKGPTHSGKGYLGNIFVGMLYCTQYGPGCHETNFKSGGYELDILLGKATQYPYVVFDEIAYVSLKDLKFIDRLATQQQIEVRKLHIGYATIPNHMTVSMTAINKEFSDETKARLVEIVFTESRPEKIKEFNEKWSTRTQELIAALYQGVSAVAFAQDIPTVEHRRTGFGVVKKALEEGLRTDTFKPRVEYPLSQSPNYLLDVIAQLFESETEKEMKGNWARYTPRKIAKFYNSISSTPVKSEYMQSNLVTALGYLTTETHPVFKKDEYPAESGAYYHIKIVQEGQGRGEDNKRSYVYIRPVDPPESNANEPREEHPSKNEPKSETTSSRACDVRPFTAETAEGSEFPIFEVES